MSAFRTRRVAFRRRRHPPEQGVAVAKYAFLSDEWIDAAKAVYDEYKGKTQPVPHAIKMNMVISEVPFGDGSVDAHMDTSSGELVMDKGHLDTADLKLGIDWATAKAIFIE